MASAAAGLHRRPARSTGKPPQQGERILIAALR